MNFLIFILAGYTIVIGLLDYMTTAVALQHGDVERNPVARWLQARLGLPLSTFVSIGAAIFTAVPLSVYFGKWVVVAWAGAMVAETFNVLNNFKLLKKQGLHLK